MRERERMCGVNGKKSDVHSLWIEGWYLSLWLCGSHVKSLDVSYQSGESVRIFRDSVRLTDQLLMFFIQGYYQKNLFCGIICTYT